MYCGLDGSGKSSTIDELLKIYTNSEAFTLFKINNVSNTYDIKVKKLKSAFKLLIKNTFYSKSN